MDNYDKFKNSSAEAKMKEAGKKRMLEAQEKREKERKEGKLPWKQWVPKYFEEQRGGHFTSIYEKVEVGFAASDLSYYELEDLEEAYQEYLDDTSDFLKYEE